ncbi:hypothetical protein [Flavobacterium sp. W21_SRS_FM6]|uniref:hypothetical protein n=1 Tax=Flavobacterium sp. W21_SRS_FM6 TaxID=3240268 RepID=UPI003F8E521B
MSKDYKQRVKELVLNLKTWEPSDDYMSIRMFCLRELHFYGVDPSSSDNPVDEELIKTRNLSESVTCRILTLSFIYSISSMFLNAGTLIINRTTGDELELKELAYAGGGSAAAHLTFGLLMSANDETSMQDYENLRNELLKLKERNIKNAQKFPICISETEKIACSLFNLKDDDGFNPSLTDIAKYLEAKYSNDAIARGDYEMPPADTIKTWLRKYKPDSNKPRRGPGKNSNLDFLVKFK